MNSLLLKIGGTALLTLGLLFGVHALDESRQALGYQRAVGEYEVKLAQAKDAAQATERMLWKQLGDAQNEATARNVEKQKLAASAALSAGRLRDTISALRARLSADPVETCRKAADTGLRLLGTCEDRYRDLAERARGHLDDTLMYQKAWP